MYNVMKVFVGMVVLSLLLGATPEESDGTPVQVAEHGTLGMYLTDAEGRSLYLFLEDKAGEEAEIESTCILECEANWPPLVVDGEPVAGEGVAPSLMGTTEREDGSTQVTYNGWPLYYYANDEEPGATTGQGVGDLWYLISPYGEPVEDQGSAPKDEGQTGEAGEEAAREDADPMLSAALMGEGEEVYTSTASPTCVSCHGQGGEGGAGPNLAGNDRLDDSSFVVRQILQGGAHMPPYGDQLSDREVAAVATFVRNSWDNTFGALTEQEVGEAQ